MLQAIKLYSEFKVGVHFTSSIISLHLPFPAGIGEFSSLKSEPDRAFDTATSKEYTRPAIEAWIIPIQVLYGIGCFDTHVLLYKT